MTDREFREAVDAALAELPAEFKRHLRDVAVVVKARPSPAERKAARLRQGTVLYGLYHGTPETARSVTAPPFQPDRIMLYREALERSFRDPALLAREIRKTVLHEVGHHFGLSERRLKRLGYG